MGREIVVVTCAPGVTVQDQGRPGWLARGVPPSGPLDPVAHAAANLAVGNDPRAAALEIPLGRVVLEARAALRVSVDGEDARTLAASERLEVAPSWSAVRYVAVAGGIDVPVVLGARATCLPGRFGGHEGRALRAGDALAVGARGAEARSPVGPSVTRPGSPATLLVLPGPHLARVGPRAWDELLTGEWRAAVAANRVGARLDGPALTRVGGDLAGPTPMVRGAVQVATDGVPIVLGPDHPVTGGYPVVAVLRASAQALFARVRPGGAVRFAL